LLNDAGFWGVPLLIDAIQRLSAANKVTVTTLVPHGFVAGDLVNVTNVPVGTLSFNGYQVVTASLNANQFTYSQTGATEGQTSGFVAGYATGAVYTDPFLLPHVNSAYRKLQRKMEGIGGPLFIQDELLFVVPAVANPDASVQVSISDSTAPPNQLPANLLEPLNIWERPNLSTQEFVEMTDMTLHGGLPSRLQGQVLEVWEWRSDQIFFIGATQDTQIRLRYSAEVIDLVDGTSPILIRNCQEALAYAAAAAAGKSRGSPLADGYAAEAEDAIEDILNRVTKREQKAGRRRRPFSSKSGWTSF
jgi:hypothetical protein